MAKLLLGLLAEGLIRTDATSEDEALYLGVSGEGGL